MSTTDPVVTGKRRAKLWVGGGLIALAVPALIVWGLTRPGAAAFYLTVTELSTEAATAAAEDIRVNGTVVAGSIEREGLTTTFEVTDGTSTVPVVTDRPLPDAFRDRSEVVAVGRYDGRTFTADQVLAKCPSKFKAKS